MAFSPIDTDPSSGKFLVRLKARRSPLSKQELEVPSSDEENEIWSSTTPMLLLGAGIMNGLDEIFFGKINLRTIS